MTETTLTNRFALFFFIYFLAASTVLSLLPTLAGLSDGAFMLISQIACFLPPVLLYFILTKKDVKQILRLNPLGWKNAVLIILFAFAIQPFMSFLSYLMSLFFPNPVEQSTAGLQESGFLISLFSVAILPAVLEEISVRGILLSGYQFLGKWKAAFACALLFGLLHMNPQQFPYAFCVGFIFCFLVDRTDSIFAAILPHLIINGTTIISMFFDPAATAPMPEEMTIGVVLTSLGLMTLISIPSLWLLLRIFLKINPPRVEPVLLDENGDVYTERFFTPAVAAIFVIYFVFGIWPYLSLA